MLEHGKIFYFKTCSLCRQVLFMSTAWLVDKYIAKVFENDFIICISMKGHPIFFIYQLQ